MIVDTSALIAILKNEPEGLRFSLAIESDDYPKLSVVSFVEAAVVTDSARDPVVSRRLDELIKLGEIEIRPVSVEQGRLARAAYRDFGRGSGHAAKLNFGDCFAYALAAETGEPLLFKGFNFLATDIKTA